MGGFFKKLFKKALPIAAAAVGTALGGPAGGIAAASLAGASQRGGGNKLKGALSGGLHGLGYTAMAPGLAGTLMPGNAMAAQLSGLNGPSLMGQFGKLAPMMNGITGGPGGGGLGLGGMLGGNGGMGGFLSNFGKGVLGGLSEKKEKKEAGQETATPAVQPLSQLQPYAQQAETFEGDSEPDDIMNGQHMHAAHGLTPLETFMVHAGRGKKKSSLWEHAPEAAQRKRDIEGRRREEFENVNKRRFKKGGFVNPKMTGAIRVSDTGAADDDVDMKLPPGSFVMNGMDVSLHGDGNTENGMKKLTQWEAKIDKKIKNNSNFEKSGITKPYEPPIDAKVSNGEYVLKPSTVTYIGKGSNDKGAKIIEKGRIALRKQKGVKSILPPKAKDINHYMKGGR